MTSTQPAASLPLRSNFRGVRACLALPEDAGAEVLARTLARLGLEVAQIAPSDAASCETPFDVAFVDADQDFEPLPRDIPHVALIGIEAPSRLTRVMRAGADAVLIKPLRVTGIFSALCLAFNAHEMRARELQEKAVLQRRAEGRRALVQAIVGLMTGHGLSEDEAYRQLRIEAMRRRIPIETHAAEVAAGFVSSGPGAQIAALGQQKSK